MEGKCCCFCSPALLQSLFPVHLCSAGLTPRLLCQGHVVLLVKYLEVPYGCSVVVF